MRLVYAIAFLVAFAALVAEHLTSPSGGRPVSPHFLLLQVWTSFTLPIAPSCTA